MKHQSKRKHLNFILIGNSNSGKTCFIKAWMNEEFRALTLPTLGSINYTKHLALKQEAIDVILWDTNGQDRYDTITKSYFRNANVIVMMYDIGNRKSFEDLATKWEKKMEEIKDKEVQIAIIGNKNDLEPQRQVSTEEGREYAKKLNCPFFETSAKEKTNINESVMNIANLYHEELINQRNNGVACIELNSKNNNWTENNSISGKCCS